MSAIIESLQDTASSERDSVERTLRERSAAIQRVRGLFKTDQLAPTG